MSLIIELAKACFAQLKVRFLEIMMIPFLVIMFIFLLFPFKDLGDLVSSKISETSHNQVNLNFDDMGINLLPAPGVHFQQVHVELQNMPPLSIKELNISPSIGGLISQKPHGRLVANGFLKGNVEISVSSGKKSEKGLDRQNIDITADGISFQDLKQTMNLPVSIKGQLSLTSKALIDLTMGDQPEVNDLNLHVKNFELLPATLDLGPFPLSIPGFKVTQLDLKGRFNDGRFYIDSTKIGQDKDEVSGSVSGNLNVSFQNGPQGPMPQFGSYEILLDLKVKKNFQDKAALFLLFIDNYKKALPDGFQYKVKLSGTQFGPPPKTSPLQ